jgi:hypothetical protein
VDEDGNLFAEVRECRGEALDGASFMIEKISEEARTPPKNTTIKIEFYGSVVAYGGDTVPGYVFREENSAKSLCDRQTSLEFQQKFNLFNTKRIAQTTRDFRSTINKPAQITIDNGKEIQDSDIAIVFAGEVRGEDGETLEKSKRLGWFNIACKRDALAKVDLDRIAPAQKSPPLSDTAYYDRRTAALKMLTANYCDKERYTYEGNEIAWGSKRLEGGWRYREAIPTGRQEAVWSKKGAACLEHTRLHYKYQIGTIPKFILPEGCRNHCKDENEFLTHIWRECSEIKHRVQDCDNDPDIYFISHSH